MTREEFLQANGNTLINNNSGYENTTDGLYISFDIEGEKLELTIPFTKEDVIKFYEEKGLDYDEKKANRELECGDEYDDSRSYIFEGLYMSEDEEIDAWLVEKVLDESQKVECLKELDLM